MKHVLIIVGHTKEKQGAIAFNSISEYKFNLDIAFLMKKHINELYRETVTAHVVTLNDKLVPTVSLLIEKGIKPDISIELHFNSFKTKARGCEMLVLGGELQSREEIALADKFTDKFAELFDIKERAEDGVKKVYYHDRGYHNLRTFSSIAKKSFLFEPCFANFKTTESIKIIKHPRHYAHVLSRLVAEMAYDFDKDHSDLISEEPEEKAVQIQKKKSCWNKIKSCIKRLF